ncbi:MAG: tyrosine-protein phosphatase [Bombilactobacillus mellifer]|nr:tyrosine-protein phosphatase [Bombilactobacillus mellifer]
MALVLTLLGVAPKTIIADYMLTKTLHLAQYAHETNDQNVFSLFILNVRIYKLWGFSR